ncbi:ABC transporter permease [Pelagibacterium lacus]|nr:ABC transporter permease [Pelagibacterium lacus]
MTTVYRVLFMVLLIALWQIASMNVGRNLIPSPLATFHTGTAMLADGRLVGALGASLSIYLTGLFLAIVIAIPLGIVMGGIRLLGKTLEVYVYALSATPRVAFIPLIIALLGLGFEAKITVVLLGAIMPILINTYAGVLAVDTQLIEMARSVGLSRTGIFVRIVLPGSVPFIIVGLRLGATIGLINTVVAELYTAVTGLGGLLAIYGNSFRMEEYFVVVLTLAMIGVVVTETLRLLESRLSGWKTAG